MGPIYKNGHTNKMAVFVYSGPDWIRTSDLLIANEMLYQLSYGPI